MTRFSCDDGKGLWSLVRRQERLVVKKRRWLASMIAGPDGHVACLKRPKFLKDLYLAESDVRSDEVSCERVKTHVERGYGIGIQKNCHQHHVFQDGTQLFNLQKGKDDSLSPGSLNTIHSTLNKLCNEALYSLASIVTRNEISFEKTRPRMKKVLKEHLPKYLAELDNEGIKSELSSILINPYNYKSEPLSLATPISPTLLSCINQALDTLDELPAQALVAMNWKLTEKPSTPRFLRAAQAVKKQRLVNSVRKRCRKITSKLEDCNDLPNNLAKALSVMILYRKLKLRRIDISQSEFFPFSRGTMSMQNDVLTALWSLEKVKPNDLKLLRPILKQGPKVDRTFFKVAVRRYLTECLFECDESNLPEEALRAIAFLIRVAPKHQMILTEERKEMEVEAVLALSSCLKSLAHGGTQACLSDDETSLGSGRSSEDNDFVLTETNYFNLGSQQQNMDSVMSNTCNMSSSIEVCGGNRNSSECEPAADMVASQCKEVAGDKNVLTTCTKDLSEICDETAIVAHKLVGRILNNMLLAENKEVDELNRGYLGGGSVSQNLQAHAAEENQKDDIVIKAIQGVLPNLSRSCMDKVRRILHGYE